MKLINYPFAIDDKILNSLDYKKGIIFMRTFGKQFSDKKRTLNHLSIKSLKNSGLLKLPK